MCALCRHEPCDSRCPNAPEPIPTLHCESCREGIYVGDKYFDSSKGPICRDCLRDMSAEEILELVGEDLKEAKEE